MKFSRTPSRMTANGVVPPSYEHITSRKIKGTETCDYMKSLITRYSLMTSKLKLYVYMDMDSINVHCT